MDIGILTDHKEKIKENEKRDQYLNLTRELKKLWNMKLILFTQTIHSGRIWHKVNFFSGV